MDRRSLIIPLVLMLALASFPLAVEGADAAGTHYGGEGHGEGIDAVYSYNPNTGELGTIKISLAQVPQGDVFMYFISYSDDQYLGLLEASKFYIVEVKPFVLETYTVQVTLGQSGPVIAECELFVTETVSLTYSAEGGSGIMPQSEVVPGGTVKLAQNGFDAPLGKKFLNWSINGRSYQPGDEIEISQDTTAKAVWTDADAWIITFDANGGSGLMPARVVDHGKSMTLPQCGFTAPEGKEFSAWEISGKEYKAGDQFTPESNAVVKAVWKTPSSGDDMTLTIVGIVAAVIVALLLVIVLLKRRK